MIIPQFKYFIAHFWGYFWKIPPFSFLYRTYYSLRLSWPVWFYVLNRNARECYRKNLPKLDDLQERVAGELARTGISVLHFDDLFPGMSFSIFQENLQRTMREPENQKRIEEQKKGGVAATKKYYLVELWQKPFYFDPDNPFMRLATNERILGVIGRYLNMACCLSYMNLWYTVPMEKTANYSQRWHRDPDDRRLVKMFLYLTDVHEGAGPFHYVPGSHDPGPYRRVISSKPPYSTYPKEGEVEKLFSKDKIRTCTGRAGTIIFCDTKGLHKGGHATKDPRILFNAVYLTEGAIPAEKKKLNYYLNGFKARAGSLGEHALKWAGKKS